MAYAYSGGASPLQQHAQIYPQGYPARSASPQPPTSPPPIQPGSITYTTTTGPDGQPVYHQFRAVPASYQTAQGIVNGIQWVPAEATSILPAGAMPAGADFAAAFSRPSSGQGDWARRDKEDRRYDKERRYREDKEYRKDRERDRDDRDYRREHDREDGRYREERRRTGDYHGGYDKDRRYSAGSDDLERRFDDLGLDRERDREHDYDRKYGKERRREREREKGYRDKERDREYEREKIKSHRGSPYAPVAPGLPGAAPYATAPYPPVGYGGGSIARSVSPYQAGIAPRPASPYQHPAPVAPRPVSPYPAAPMTAPRSASPYQAAPMTAPRSASPYQVGGVLPPQATSPYHGGAAVPRPVSPYHGAMTPVAPRPVSPYMPGAVPRAVSPRPQYYPSGHVMEGQPVPGTGIIPRSASPGMPGPSPYATSALGSSPSSYPMNMPRQGYPEQQMLSSPEGFSRPPNLSQPYTPFEVLKVQDLDDFFESMPKMPLALVSHDVYHEDWIRFMTDLTLSWSGKLPTPDYAREAGPPRRTALTGDLVDLWNVSFFLKRGVEVILYKGRERRSGREIGRVDVHLPGFDDYPGDYDSEDSLTEDSDDYNSGGDDRYAYGAYGGSYGRQTESQMHDLHEAKQRDRRAREKRRAEKKKRRQEKRHRRRQKEAERKYALYLSYVPPS